MERFFVDPEIAKAETLPASFYKSSEVFDRLNSLVFPLCWHWIGAENDLLPLSESVYPFEMGEEPLIIIKDKADHLACLSNVCTHRGNILVHNPGRVKKLTCLYHGRRFDLNGKFRFMPEFKDVENFPRPCESLPNFDIGHLCNHLFVSLNPGFEFSDISTIILERIGFLNVGQFKYSPSHSKEYLVNCHWALYCDNYLEGFHIPFVHADLNEALDFGQYETLLYEHLNLQIGFSDKSKDTFVLPEEHPDYGRNVSAYYYWIFPNMMFNFYPWGLSVNVVKPVSLNRTKISFHTYIYNEEKMDSGAGAVLDKVEREDEFVVEGVHRGLKSKYYKSGRFSPTREQGVHHFHQLLARYLNNICKSLELES